ncbi:MAG: hypothetical protein AAB378_02900 [Patescibacteria group bacterium]
MFFIFGNKICRRIFNGGFGLAEIVVGAAIISVSLFGLVAASQLALRVADENTKRVQASFLLEEGVEAVRVLRDGGWNVYMAPLSVGSAHYLEFSGSFWRATTTNIFVDGKFERSFTVNNVYRNVNDDIAGAGTLDPDTKKVTVTVAWRARTGTTTESISTYFTDLFNN